MIPRKETKYIVVHCSATQAKSDIGANEIDVMHRVRGFDCIGYHYVIRRNGLVSLGRLPEMIGAHAYGVNQISVGVCLVGGYGEFGKFSDHFTGMQDIALANLLERLQQQYPGAQVIGHRDVPNTNKTCPNFDVALWMASRK